MDYRQALDYLLSFADYERASTSRIRYRDFNLERVRQLLTRIDRPDRRFASIHIAGTKGKGSTAAMIASILNHAGYRTGLYTSPHLHTMRERIAVGGSPISEEAFARGVEALSTAVTEVNAQDTWGRLTTFELLTALGFHHFANEGVRHAVVEVGLGGRLDATNVLSPQVTAVTNISLDHTEVLGDSLAQIAAEKAGIIKPGIPVICAPQTPEALEVIRRTAAEKGSPLTLVGRDVVSRAIETSPAGQTMTVTTARGEREIRTPLLGAHQRENVAMAVAVVEALEERGVAVPPDAVRLGLERVEWPGRLEVLSRQPLIVADGAHNPYSMKRLVEALEETFDFERVVAVFGGGRSKRMGPMLGELARLSRIAIVATRSRHPKAAPVDDIVREAAALGMDVTEAGETAAALALARELAGPDDLIVATGSLFVAAEARETILGIEPEIDAGVALV